MGVYELIKADENGIPDPNRNFLSIEEGHKDADLESAGQISMSKSKAPVFAAEDNAPKRRLVSLDVFRGSTVAV